MAVDTAQLIKGLKKEVAPVYLIAGDEDALIDRALAAITETCLLYTSPSPRDCS